MPDNPERLDYVIVPLQDHHTVGAFECGDAEVEDHLTREARHANQHGLITTLIASPSDASPVILGYISFRITERSDHRGKTEKKSAGSRFNLPCVFISFLGVDSKYQRKGIGTALLVNVYRRCAFVSDQVACFGVMLARVETEEAKQFYETRGMANASSSVQSVMYIRADEIKRLLNLS